MFVAWSPMRSKYLAIISRSSAYSPSVGVRRDLFDQPMLDLIEVVVDGIVVADDLLCQQYITFYESINTICDHFYRGAGHFAHEFACPPGRGRPGT